MRYADEAETTLENYNPVTRRIRPTEFVLRAVSFFAHRINDRPPPVFKDNDDLTLLELVCNILSDRCNAELRRRANALWNNFVGIVNAA